MNRSLVCFIGCESHSSTYGTEVVCAHIYQNYQLLQIIFPWNDFSSYHSNIIYPFCCTFWKNEQIKGCTFETKKHMKYIWKLPRKDMCGLLTYASLIFCSHIECAHVTGSWLCVHDTCCYALLQNSAIRSIYQRNWWLTATINCVNGDTGGTCRIFLLSKSFTLLLLGCGYCERFWHPSTVFLVRTFKSLTGNGICWWRCWGCALRQNEDVPERRHVPLAQRTICPLLELDRPAMLPFTESPHARLPAMKRTEETLTVPFTEQICLRCEIESFSQGVSDAQDAGFQLNFGRT